MRTITLYKVRTDSDGYTSRTAAQTTDKALAEQIAAILGDGYSLRHPASIERTRIEVAERIEDVYHPRMARHLKTQAEAARQQAVAAADPAAYRQFLALKAQFEP